MYRRIGYLGPEGSLTEQAVTHFLADPRLSGAIFTPVDEIPSLLTDLYFNRLDAAITPPRNSLAGDYEDTTEGFSRYHLNEIDRVTLEIHLAIGIHPQSTHNQIREIRSKDTALEECSNYLDRSFPNASRIAVSSTAGAVRQVMAETLLTVAAVGSEAAMRRYGLLQLDTKIENANNFTTFVLLARE